MTRFAMAMIALAVSNACLVPLGSRNTAACAEPDATQKDNVLAEFDVGAQSDLLIVPVTIDGREYPFVLDTGSTFCVVDATLHPLLQKTGRRATINGDAGFELYRLPQCRLGPIQIPAGTEAVSVDLLWLRVVSWRDIRGVLGMNVLKEHVVRIDNASGSVQFLRHCFGFADAEFSIFFNDAGLPYIQTKFLSGKSARFVVDSGWAGGGALQAKTFDRLVKCGSLTASRLGVHLKFEGFGIERRASMKWPQVARFSPRHRSFSRADWGNILGLGFLSAYDVTFDFPNEILQLQRGQLLAELTPESHETKPSEYEKLFSDYQESNRDEPKDVAGYLSRASARLENHQYRKAVEDCTKAIRLNPKSARAYLIRGRARLNLDDFGSHSNRAKADLDEYHRLTQQETDFLDCLLLGQ